MRVQPYWVAIRRVGGCNWEAKKSAIVSHNHPEALRGAQCIAEAICWLRLMRFSKSDVERKVEKFFGYELPPMRDIKKVVLKDTLMEPVRETVPMALRCFMDANSFEGDYPPRCTM